MKVLFAVSNENISTQIVKRYQREYKEIISYKNMYYFNAIIKELQRDKSYDRIVISEDLEPFANNNYDEIEKFLFEKLDNITDEATGINGKVIPIILLASDKRTKAESILVKLFGIGIYNALLGQDRSTENVCNLLNKPRTKKEAKIYYKIDSDDVSYKSESEDNVSEAEIKNILNHYRRLGKDEDRYIESFNNIAAQYNDAQLRIITKFLPLNVKAVLEEKSPKYQSVMTFADSTSTMDLMKSKKEEEGLKVGFLNYANTRKPIEPVIVPTAVKKVATKKAINPIQPRAEENIYETKPVIDFEEIEENQTDFVDVEETTKLAIEPVKRGRGRPKKIVPEDEQNKTNIVKRGRGRPKKVVQEELEIVEDTTVSNFDELEEMPKETVLPGFDEVEENTLGTFEDLTKDAVSSFDKIEEKRVMLNNNEEKNNLDKDYYSNISALLSRDKKIVSFVGTTKNGTSFIINNLAKCLSAKGIKTAILDLTSNRNSFYIYTKNEEKLRTIAYDSIKKLEQGITNGITVDKNLDVYTALPGDKLELENVNKIITTLIKNYSIVLMDCDFSTPAEYFSIAQEIYVVQTMDILTIQPMTAFLRELKAKNVLEAEKIRIIINKEMKVNGLTNKAIIGGLAFYNDPAMSFMAELFNKDTVKYCTIPFEEEVCKKYLEGVMDCSITINGYPKSFVAKLKELANMVYPLIGNKYKSLGKYSSNYNFSDDMNYTLKQMKNKY